METGRELSQGGRKQRMYWPRRTVWMITVPSWEKQVGKMFNITVFLFAKMNTLVCALTRDPDTAMSSSVLMLTLTTSSMCPYNTWTGLGQSPTGLLPWSPKEIDRCTLNLMQNEWYESRTNIYCSNLLLNLPHHAGCVSGARDKVDATVVCW